MDEQFGLPDIIKVEKCLKKACIKIVFADNFKTFLYTGILKRDVTGFLYKNKNHFDVITKMGAVLGTPNYFNRCDTQYKHKNHKYKALCVTCGSLAHAGNKSAKYCNECNRYCYNEECFEQHKKEVCQTVYKCLQCNKIIKRNEETEHKCGYEICVNCEREVETKIQLCYMQWKWVKVETV
jgi:hypothetical protein